MPKRSLIFLCAAVLISAVAVANAQAQYQVLYNFGASSSADGAIPRGKLVLDQQGNLYGTTVSGGVNANGTVFELSPSVGGQWTEIILYNFGSSPDGSDGAFPMAGLIFDSAGDLYGTTQLGGGPAGNWGAVFELSPPVQEGGAWTETVLYAFGGNSTGDGCYPEGKLTFDASGNLYGTTSACGGGNYSAGSVFELTRSGDGTWSEIVLHQFCKKGLRSCPDGGVPKAGVTFDKAGNLFGTTSRGGRSKNGVVYELSPAPGGWKETVLQSFGSGARGSHPASAINFDELGNLYGTAFSGGSASSSCDDFSCGSVFRMTPSPGGWKYSALLFSGTNGGNPAAGVFLDTKHNTIYGTTTFGGPSAQGTIYKIHGQTETVLYNFCSQPLCADGSQPTTTLASDGKGNLFGVTTEGGPFGQGVVFEITP